MVDASRPTLLIVEDDTPIRLLLTRLGERAGFDVDHAPDGSDALQLLDRKAYDVAVIDLNLPRVSGYEVMAKIASMPPPRTIVLVATVLAAGDVKVDDTLVRRLIKKPFELGAMSGALGEAAREVLARREEAKSVPVPSADDALLSVIPIDEASEPAPATDAVVPLPDEARPEET